ncbi:D-3-phosphoglycerate dehydrogenase [Spinactinospora alkalitolerans]|uniref:D-3-phosphoglycerate dehydrogenase n=1 Tax=Spinactinospora alkalitolerans TaxID=687207 RepID=A0A852TVQ6_9ACTN|nr:NAD(P)-dependent oxidoreductase [Spinactinospora alkalitolerans]NYE46164.1 D-3-phosphoglycerate dehydrogenase [Spinactinospora alkalitolerans]
MADPCVAIADTGGLDPAPAVELLTGEGFDVRVLGTSEPGRIAAGAPAAVALIVHDTAVDAALLDRLPALRLVVSMSDDAPVDAAAAERRGLWVARLPQGREVDQVAHHALALALAQLRRLARDHGDHRRPRDLTLGLVGMSKVATRFAELARPLFGRIVGVDPYARAWPPGVDRLDLGALLPACDVVSLHTPLTSETAGMIDAGAIARMRRGAILVNIARHGLVDRKDVLTALHTGRLAGLASGHTPAADRHAHELCPLRSHPAVLISPSAPAKPVHYTRDRVLRLARNVLAWRDRGIPLDPVVRSDSESPLVSA